MKTTILQSFFKMALLLIGMAAVAGCDDSDDTKTDESAQHSLTGEDIYWKLTKIVEKGEEIKNIKELAIDRTFTLSFEGDGDFKKEGKFKGFTSTNDIEGTYTTDDASSAIRIQIELTSEVMESEFGNRYVHEILPAINTQTHVDEYLNLHYGENSYLTYQLNKKKK